MVKVKQSKEELKKLLREQIGFIQRSADAYDNGFKDEAKRLAVNIRVLFHDTKQSKSLLEQLGLKKSLGLYDTSTEYDPDNLVSHDGLTRLRLNANVWKYIPRLEDEVTLKNTKIRFFSDWWNKVVIVDKNKTKFSRGQIVLSVANKDGGAHVDPTLEKEYSDLTRNNSMNWFYGNDGKPVLSIELASIRQITHEVIASLKRKLPEYFV